MDQQKQNHKNHYNSDKTQTILIRIVWSNELIAAACDNHTTEIVQLLLKDQMHYNDKVHNVHLCLRTVLPASNLKDFLQV